MRAKNGYLRVAWAMALLVGLAAPAAAQGTAISLGDGADPDAPVEIVSDRLELDQDGGVAAFIGNVEVVQDDLRLTAARVDVTYSTGNDGAGGEIESLRATGGVTFTGGADVATSREAVFDPESGRLRMTGDVILTQGRNALGAEALDMDIETGNGVLTGRVRAVLRTGSGN